MKNILLFLLVASVSTACSSNHAQTDTVSLDLAYDQDKYKKAYFAAGCFWCVEAIFESVEGVEEAISGYSGGKELNPSYEEVGYGRTTHAEAVEVIYDPSVVSFATLLEVYYGSHNPTTVDGQKPDFGRQYRSMILCTSKDEMQQAIAFKKALDESGKYGLPVATEIVSFQKFWKAEAYHQNFERLNPSNSYVKSVSIPRLNRFKAKFPQLLKKNH
jgi:peptide-methionine (S)-S-oxide reductase